MTIKAKLITSCAKNKSTDARVYLLTTLHFLISLFWEKSVFIFRTDWTEWKQQGFWLTDIRATYISDGAESIIVYILSRFFSAMLIYVFWKTIFIVVDKNASKETVSIFKNIFFVIFIIGIISYPQSFGLEIDNYGNYSRAIRFLPIYWQSVFTGAFYAACMMALPSWVGILFFQSVLFVLTIGYVFEKLEKLFPKRKVKYVLLLVFILPETYEILLNPYRNNFYTTLCLFYYSNLFFLYVERKKKGEVVLSWKNDIVFVFSSALIMIWRSEGIILGICGLFVYLLLFKNRKFVQNLIMIICFVMVFLGMWWCQQIGTIKYYGNDYLIINTPNILYNIFNNKKSNLVYEGAVKDIQAINRVVPSQILKESGLEGFRNYNWTLGRKDFNQTLATDEEAVNYMKAYYRIVYHNFEDFLKVQTNCFFRSLRIPVFFPTHIYTGKTFTPLKRFQYNYTVTDPAEIYQGNITGWWLSNYFRQNAFAMINQVNNAWKKLWLHSCAYMIIHLFAIVTDIYILILCFFRMFQKSKRWYGIFVILFFSIIGEIVGIFLFMPEGRPQYLYPMLYSSYLLIYLYSLELHFLNSELY